MPLFRLMKGCQIWTGTQNPLGLRNDVAKALELEPNQVKVNQHFMGGGFAGELSLISKYKLR